MATSILRKWHTSEANLRARIDSDFAQQFPAGVELTPGQRQILDSFVEKIEPARRQAFRARVMKALEGRYTVTDQGLVRCALDALAIP